jgi:hypothetical protein
VSALLLAVLLAVQASPESQARGTARLTATVAEVELGQPFELVLEVRHAPADRPQVEGGELTGDPAWHVLGGGEVLTLPDADDEHGRMSEVRWTVVALEAGERPLPAPVVRLAGAGGVPVELQVERGDLRVEGVLGPGEDAPRALPDELGLEELRSGRFAWLWAVGLVLVLAAALVVRRLRARARRPQAVAPPASPLQRLAELESAELETPESVRAAHFALTRALREHVDSSSSSARAALTDEEWLAALQAPSQDELAAFLESCARVKYGSELPTHWATRERVVRARELAVAHARAPAQEALP